MAADLFWSNVNTDPKRRFRFILAIGSIPVWTVKTAIKPKANVSTVEHQFINHTFKYPGRVTWDNITVTLVDPVEPDMAYTFLDKLRKSGYDYPTTSNVRGSISKAKSVVDGLGGISLQQIDSDGNVIEEWFLKNPWIVSVDFGGNLDYTADEMNEITVEVAYDWAEMKIHQNAAI
tara:strand:+ start:70 stop:597 length:528 start_codon:yes stop_codon:yes gene_type:complete